MPTPQRLPIVNSDDGSWGAIIRQFLMKEHVNDDSDTPSNGGHKNVTIQAGTTTAAPLTFKSGPLLSTPATGAMEFNNNSLYFTQTTGTTRKKVILYDDSTGATGDIYYRDASGNTAILPIGTTNQQLRVSNGLPSWLDPASTNTTYALKGITADYTVTTSDKVIFANASSNNITLALPAASTVSGNFYYVKRIDGTTNTVTIDPNGSETIDGYDTVTLGDQYSAVMILAASSYWYVLDAGSFSSSSGGAVADGATIDGGTP